jgi:tetratricopeptide (TPR) repeat protein
MGRRIIAALLLASTLSLANSHREAPTTLEQAAAITDFYAFVSPEDTSKVTFILHVDSAFDPTVLYAIHVDDRRYEFRSTTAISAAGLRQTYSVAAAQRILAPSLNENKVECFGDRIRVFAGARDIALELPRETRVTRAWAASYRTRTLVRRTHVPAIQEQIQRAGNPLADGSEPDLLLLDTTRPSGYPNGRRLTDDVMAIALHTPPAAPPKGAYLDNFPYVRVVPAPPKSDTAADKQITLAASYIQKLRETADGGYLDRAAKILDSALAADGRNYEAQRLRNEVALHRHEFKFVAQESRRLAGLAPRDPRNWGTLGDALMELGDYDQAADAYQRMVDLRPGLSSLNRVAFYRFVSGDPDGAISAMQEAIAAGSSIPENIAWCLVDLGWMYFKTGKTAEAGEAFGNALRVFPGYHRAHAGMGQVLAAQGKIHQAIDAYRLAQAVVPMPEYAGALVELYSVSGNEGQAKKQRDLLDLLDQIGRARGETTNRSLALVYADQGRNLDRALQLAQAELDSRRDVYSYDALAWVLYRTGRYAEAAEASAKALRLKTPEPAFRHHARMITAALGNRAEAKGGLR